MIHRLRSLLAALAVAVLAGAASPPAPLRLALVIGNGSYAAMAPLPNATRDAALVAATLRDAGYGVVEASNLSGAALAKRVAEVAARTAAAPAESVLIVYYAGHGFAVGGRSVILPIDARLRDGRLDPATAVPLDGLLRSLGGGDEVSKIMVVDACRDLLTLRERGLPVSSLTDVPKPDNSFILYSTGNGVPAADGAAGEYSPFAISFVRGFEVAGRSIGDVAADVAGSVYERTLHSQRPESFSSLRRRVVLNDRPISAARKLYVEARDAFLAGQVAAGVDRLRRSAALGDPRAMISYGDALFHGQDGVGKDVGEAIVWYARAAAAGESDGYMAQGQAYQQGPIGIRDEAQAELWYDRAIAAGNMEAMYNLARMIQDRQPTRAADLYRRSLPAYNCCSAVNLALLYKNGRGVPHDLVLAERYARIAADRGNYKGTDILAAMAIGRGDYAIARRLLHTSVARGSPFGATQLGVLAGNGWGEPANRTLAAQWFRTSMTLARKTGEAAYVEQARAYLAQVGERAD